MDDTLFDHTRTARAAIGSVRRKLPSLHGYSLDELSIAYAEILEATHPDVLRGRWSHVEARAVRWRRLIRRFGGRPTPAAVEEIAELYRRVYLARQRPVPGAPELVRWLHRRMAVGIVTNNTVAEQERKLRFLGLGRVVDALVVSERVGAEKPDPRIFRAALRELSVGAEEAVMVGDSWRFDVEGARAAGIRAVWFNRFRRPAPAGPPAEEIRSLRPADRIGRRLNAFGRRGPDSARIISRPPMHSR